MAFREGSFCMFTPPSNHPLQKRKLGKILELSTSYIQNFIHYKNLVIEDVYGKWEIKTPIKYKNNNDIDLSGISGPYWEDKDSIKDVEYFTKPIEYFQSVLPPKLKCQTSLHTKETIEAAKQLLKPPVRDLLAFERSLIGDLLNLKNIFSKIAYSIPKTLKDTQRYSSSDSKQGAYYATSDTYSDIIFQYQISSASAKNRMKGLKEYIDCPRNKLSEKRGEELRIAIVLFGETICNWIQDDNTGDETEIEEIDYIDLLKQTDNIVQRAISI
jgi:hypothetical protein